MKALRVIGRSLVRTFLWLIVALFGYYAGEMTGACREALREGVPTWFLLGFTAFWWIVFCCCFRAMILSGRRCKCGAIREMEGAE